VHVHVSPPIVHVLMTARRSERRAKRRHSAGMLPLAMLHIVWQHRSGGRRMLKATITEQRAIVVRRVIQTSSQVPEGDQ
jgi:hypothetical protein